MVDTVDFSGYALDTLALAKFRKLSQFKDSPVMLGVLTEQTRQTQELYDALIATMEGRTLLGAVGVNLDIIGQIVGQPRTIKGINGNLPLGDDQYRQFIIAKIFKNHCLHGSVPEVLQFAKIAFGVDISITKLGLSDIYLVVPSTIDPTAAAALSLRLDDERAENQYFAPFGATTRILKTIFRPAHPFAPDRVDGRPDFAHLSVGV